MPRSRRAARKQPAAPLKGGHSCTHSSVESMSEPRDDDQDATLLVVGYVAGPHGVRGGVRVHLHDPRSPALEPGRRITLRRNGRVVANHEVRTVDAVPGKPGRMRVTLVGVPGRNEAEALRGCELLVAREHLPALGDDEFYLADAIGLPVVREHDGQALGTIVALTSNGMQDLFEVEWRGPDGRARTWLLPVLPDCLVEVDDVKVLVDLPLGLLPDELEPEGAEGDDDGSSDGDGDGEPEGADDDAGDDEPESHGSDDPDLAPRGP